MEDERKHPPVRLKKISLVGKEVEKATFIVEGLEEEFKADLISLLKECQYVFAWSSEYMPSLSTRLVTHRLAIDPTFKLVKQVARNFINTIDLQINKGIEKLLDAGFIKPYLHPI